MNSGLDRGPTQPSFVNQLLGFAGLTRILSVELTKAVDCFRELLGACTEMR